MLNRKDFDDAITFCQKVLAFCEARNLRMFISDFLYFQGQTLVGLNRLDEAREVLGRALVVLRETGGRWYFCEIAGLLAMLEEKAGDVKTAADLRAPGWAILKDIVGHVPEGELRVSIVDLPDIRQLLAKID